MLLGKWRKRLRDNWLTQVVVVVVVVVVVGGGGGGASAASGHLYSALYQKLLCTLQ